MKQKLCWITILIIIALGILFGTVLRQKDTHSFNTRISIVANKNDVFNYDDFFLKSTPYLYDIYTHPDCYFDDALNTLESEITTREQAILTVMSMQRVYGYRQILLMRQALKRTDILSREDLKRLIAPDHRWKRWAILENSSDSIVSFREILKNTDVELEKYFSEVLSNELLKWNDLKKQITSDYFKTLYGGITIAISFEIFEHEMFRTIYYNPDGLESIVLSCLNTLEDESQSLPLYMIRNMHPAQFHLFTEVALELYNRGHISEITMFFGFEREIYGKERLRYLRSDPKCKKSIEKLKDHGFVLGENYLEN